MTSATGPSDKWEYWLSYTNLIHGLAVSSVETQKYVDVLRSVAQQNLEQTGTCSLITYANIEKWLYSMGLSRSDITALIQNVVMTIARQNETARYGLTSNEFVLFFLLLLVNHADTAARAQCFVDAKRQLSFIYYDTEGRGYLNKDAWNELCDLNEGAMAEIKRLAASQIMALGLCSNACSLTERTILRREDAEQYFRSCGPQGLSYKSFYEACQRGYIREPDHIFHWPTVSEALRFTMEEPPSGASIRGRDNRNDASEMRMISRKQYCDASSYESNSANSAEVATALDAAIDCGYSPTPIPHQRSSPAPQHTEEVTESVSTCRIDTSNRTTSSAEVPPAASIERQSSSKDEKQEEYAPLTTAGEEDTNKILASSEPAFATPRLGRSSDTSEKSSSENPFKNCEVPLKVNEDNEANECVSTAIGTTPNDDAELKERVITNLIKSVTPPTSHEIAHLYSRYVLEVLRDKHPVRPTFAMLNDLQRLCMISILLLREERPFDKICVDEGGKVCVIGHLRGRERRLRNTMLNQFPQLRMSNDKMSADLNKSYVIFTGNYLDSASSLDYAESLRMLMMLLTMKIVFQPRVKLLRGIMENIGYEALKKDIASVPGVTENQACALWNMVMDVLQNLPLGCLVSDWGVVYGGHLTEDVVTILPYVHELSPLLAPLEQSSMPSGPNVLSLKRTKPNESEMIAAIWGSYNQMIISAAPALIRLRTLNSKITYVVANGCHFNPKQPTQQGSDFTVLCSVGRNKICVDAMPVQDPTTSKPGRGGSSENAMPRPKSVEEEAIETFCNSISK